MPPPPASSACSAASVSTAQGCKRPASVILDEHSPRPHPRRRPLGGGLYSASSCSGQDDEEREQTLYSASPAPLGLALTLQSNTTSPVASGATVKTRGPEASKRAVGSSPQQCAGISSQVSNLSLRTENPCEKTARDGLLLRDVSIDNGDAKGQPVRSVPIKGTPANRQQMVCRDSRSPGFSEELSTRSSSCMSQVQEPMVCRSSIRGESLGGQSSHSSPFSGTIDDYIAV